MTTFSLGYSYSYKLAELLSCVLSLSMHVRPNIKSVFETGSGGCRYCVSWKLTPIVNISVAEKLFLYLVEISLCSVSNCVLSPL